MPLRMIKMSTLYIVHYYLLNRRHYELVLYSTFLSTDDRRPGQAYIHDVDDVDLMGIDVAHDAG